MSGNQEAFQKAMNQGNSSAWDQAWEQASRYYRLALEEFPDNVQALTNLGLALLEMREYNDALQYYQKAAKLAPEDPVPVDKMARIFERQGRVDLAVRASIQAAELFLRARDVEKAIQNWNQVLSMQPENIPARSRLATVYEKTGRKAEAVTQYLAMASILQSAGDRAKAAQLVQYALQLMPDSVDANAAQSLLQSNLPLPKPPRPRGGTGPMRMAEVRQLQAPVEETAPPTPDPITEAKQNALVEIAALLFEQEDDPPISGSIGRRGISSLTRGTGGLTMGQNDRSKVLLHLSQVIDSQSHGQDAQAAEELERAVNTGLNKAAALFDLGLLLVERDPQKALRYLQMAIKHPTYALACNLLIGSIHESNQNYREAAIAYLQALRLADAAAIDSKLADEVSQLYEPIIDAQNRETDEENFKKICRAVAEQVVRPDWKRYLQTARQQLPIQHEGNPPLPLAEMLLESHSGQVVESLANVRRLAAKGKLSSAMEEAFHALQYAPTYLPLHIQIGELLAQEGRLPEAVQKFILVAQLYSLRGETTQAIRLLERVLQLAPMDLNVRNQLIELLTAQGRVDEAIQQYIDLASIYYSLAELTLARETYVAALRLAQESNTSREWPVKILTQIADIDMQRIDLRQAYRIFEQLRTLEPENSEHRRHLIDLSFRTGQDSVATTELDGYLAVMENAGKRAEAIQFVSDLINEYPERLELRKRLADMYVRSGEIEKAVVELDNLADMLMSRGNRAAAIAIVQAVISLNPPNVQEYRTVLKELRGG